MRLMSRKSNVWLWVVLFLSLMILGSAGCSSSTTAVGTQTKDSLSAQTANTNNAKVPIRITVGIDPVYTPFYVADKLGLYAKYGLDATTKMFSVGREGLEAVVSGQADVNGTTPTPPATMIDQGGDMVFVGAHTIGEDVVNFVAKKEITSAKDLIGKKLGYVKGTASEYAWMRYLKFHGIPKDKVTFVNVDAPEMIPIMQRGDIDAFALWEPFPTKAVQTLGDKVHILAKGSDNNVYVAILNLAFSRKYTQEHPDGVKDLIKALREAGDYVKNNPQQAAEIVAKAINSDDVQGTLFQLQHSQYGVMLNDQVMNDFKDTSAWLKENGVIKSDVDWSKYIDPSFLKAVDPSAVKLSK